MQEKEIGSEFWLNSELFKNGNGAIAYPKWLTRFTNVVALSSGRSAISLMLKEINSSVPKVVLLPSYICESVILPFLQQDYTCLFYKINRDLTPDTDSISEYMNVGIFVHMGYYGFQTNANLDSIIKHFKSQSTVIVEDITHTLFSDFIGVNQNDYMFSSVRKWMGLPSGGFLVSSEKPVCIDPIKGNPISEIRKEALHLKYLYTLYGDEKLKDRSHYLFSRAERLLNNDVELYSMDYISKKVIQEYDIDLLKEKRRANFMQLQHSLQDNGLITSIFGDLPDSVCPIFFPLFIESKRDLLRNELALRQIYCPVHWPVPNIVNVDLEKDTTYIYKNILSIPCDQRYGLKDMKYIIDSIYEIKKLID
jgi:dTDP-4-amino-4,6-dideoxygalactose transaminase